VNAKVAVLGDGGWGTALALAARRAGRPASLWSAFPDYAAELAASRENARFLPGVHIPQDILVTADPAAALAGADIVITAIPTQFLRATVARASGSLPEACLLLSVSKGLERETLLRPSEILTHALPGRPVAVLSGPSHAEEVARGLPASVVAASPSAGAAARVQAALMSPTLRIYTSTDVVGVEIGAALKNVIALAAGCADGLALGDNAKAALITRGLAELARLGAALGARPETFSGLSGLGDLVVTCTSRHSRNRAFGERLGRGERAAEITASMRTVAEGVPTTEAAVGLAGRHGIELPIAEAILRVLQGGDPSVEVQGLMTRAPRSEA
jgi:glycerol-3-phosphate dehydrogenase (NAD(P)+)